METANEKKSVETIGYRIGEFVVDHEIAIAYGGIFLVTIAACYPCWKIFSKMLAKEIVKAMK